MLPESLNIDIYRGTTLLIQVQCEDDDGTPADLTGLTPFSTAKKVGSSLISFNLNPSVIDAINGLTQLHLTDEQTSAIELAAYTWDLVFEDGSGQVFRPVFSGYITTHDISSVVS